MKELSEHILDIAQNAVAAGASALTISLAEDHDSWLTILIRDNGRGMSPQLLASVSDPFTTTRTTRNVGLGIPLLRMAAELTGGSLDIQSALGVGTTVTARFSRNHLDCPPIGSIADSIALLIQGNPDMEIFYCHSTPRGTSTMSTEELRPILGDDVPLSEPAVFVWIQDTLTQQEAQIEEERFQ
jgi:hypothetical protein